MSSNKKIHNSFIIYKIVNLVNGMVYIGQTVKALKYRFSAHGRDDGYLSRAILKYGKENFAISCAIKCNSWEEMNAKETFCIRIFNSLAPNGYNLTTGGDANQAYSKETIKKMSEGQKKRWAKGTGTENCLKALNDPEKPHPFLGKKMSKEHVENLSKSHMGYVMPQSQKEAIGKGNKGKVRTVEAKLKYTNNQYNLEKAVWVEIYNKNNDEMIGTWKSLSDCAKDLNVLRGSLQNNIAGKSKSFGNLYYAKVIKKTLEQTNI